MAVCPLCKREMLTASGCTYMYVKTKDDKYIQRQKVGEEGIYHSSERCHDCGALFGYYHHPGCDVERCPKCGEQLMDCSCDVVGFAE